MASLADLRRRPSYAAVAATAALVLAGTGTGVAAGRVLDGRQLRAGSVSAAKLAPAARAAFARQPRVLQADTGPTVVTSASAVTADAVTLAVPAGAWLISGTAAVTASGGELIAACQVRPAAGAAPALLSPPAYVSAPAFRAGTATAQVPVTLAQATRFVLRCARIDGTGLVVVASASLTALEVGAASRAVRG